MSASARLEPSQTLLHPLNHFQELLKSTTSGFFDSVTPGWMCAVNTTIVLFTKSSQSKETGTEAACFRHIAVLFLTMSHTKLLW